MLPALELFWFDLDDPLGPEALSSLAPDERARAERYLTPRHGAHFLAARATLRWLLARRLGCAPAQVRFELGAHGKPAVAAGLDRNGTALHFNLSHSGHYGLVGMDGEQELGVDIEVERPSRDDLGLARRFFTASEASWLEALPADQRAHGFCRLWTCKEAWMKSDGRGMALPLNQVEVSFAGAGAELRAVAPPWQAWHVRELDLLPGYAAAVAMLNPPAVEARVERLRAGGGAG